MKAISGSKPTQSSLRQVEVIDCTLIENSSTTKIITDELILEEELVSDEVRQSQSSRLPSTTDDFRPPSPVELQAESVTNSISAPKYSSRPDPIRKIAAGTRKPHKRSSRQPSGPSTRTSGGYATSIPDRLTYVPPPLPSRNQSGSHITPPPITQVVLQWNREQLEKLEKARKEGKSQGIFTVFDCAVCGSGVTCTREVNFIRHSEGTARQKNVFKKYNHGCPICPGHRKPFNSFKQLQFHEKTADHAIRLAHYHRYI